MKDSDLKQMPEQYWKEKLPSRKYAVLRQKGTETPYSGELLKENRDGMFVCGACGVPLFNSQTKYESTLPGLMGWPSFSEAVSADVIELVPDDSLGMSRTEVICANCGGHLGHLFDDHTSPNGKHYCINSASLDFTPEPKV